MSLLVLHLCDSVLSTNTEIQVLLECSEFVGKGALPWEESDPRALLTHASLDQSHQLVVYLLVV